MVFPVVSDADGALFRRLTNGWVPCNILVGRDGTVLFSENEFDEDGYTRVIASLYGAPAGAEPERGAEGAVPRRGSSKAANIVILGAGVGGIVAAHHLRRQLPKKASCGRNRPVACSPLGVVFTLAHGGKPPG